MVAAFHRNIVFEPDLTVPAGLRFRGRQSKSSSGGQYLRSPPWGDNQHKEPQGFHIRFEVGCECLDGAGLMMMGSNDRKDNVQSLARTLDFAADSKICSAESSSS